jgi:hypothetical protein
MKIQMKYIAKNLIKTILLLGSLPTVIMLSGAIAAGLIFLVLSGLFAPNYSMEAFKTDCGDMWRANNAVWCGYFSLFIWT